MRSKQYVRQTTPIGPKRRLRTPRSRLRHLRLPDVGVFAQAATEAVIIVAQTRTLQTPNRGYRLESWWREQAGDGLSHSPRVAHFHCRSRGGPMMVDAAFDLIASRRPRLQRLRGQEYHGNRKARFGSHSHKTSPPLNCVLGSPTASGVADSTPRRDRISQSSAWTIFTFANCRPKHNKTALNRAQYSDRKRRRRAN